jgi:hypothetical protein
MAKLIKRKKLKKLVKPVQKMVKQHGPKVATALVTATVTYLATEDGNQKIKSLQKYLRKAQENGNFVTGTAAGVADNVISAVMPSTDDNKKRRNVPAAEGR